MIRPSVLMPVLLQSYLVSGSNLSGNSRGEDAYTTEGSTNRAFERDPRKGVHSSTLLLAHTPLILARSR